MRVVYTGNVVGCNTVDFLPEGIAGFLRTNPEAEVSFHFFGGMEKGYDRRLTAPPLDRAVHVHSTVSRERAAEEQARADLLLSFLADRPGAELKNPAKMAEYARSGRPVLAAAPEGDMTRLVRRLGMGYAVPPTAEGVAGGLRRAWRDYATGGPMPKPDPAEVEDVYDMRRGFRRLDRFLRALLPGGGAPRR
jgi:hypothetical protein